MSKRQHLVFVLRHRSVSAPQLCHSVHILSFFMASVFPFEKTDEAEVKPML